MDQSLLYPIIGGLIALGLSWLIIRSAVKSALRDHQEWLEDRAAEKSSS